MNFETSGADYLQRLKNDQEGELARSAEPVVSTPPGGSAAGPERRRSPRYECRGSAEFRAGGTNVRPWGTFTDLSLNGSYVEMTATFSVGAMVDLGLEWNGVNVEVKGEVRVSYPFLRIGIGFHEMTPENRAPAGKGALAAAGGANGDHWDSCSRCRGRVDGIARNG